MQFITGQRTLIDIFQRGHTNGRKTHEKIFNINNLQENANENHNEISPHIFQNHYHHKGITSVSEDVAKRELLCTVDGNINWYSHYGKQYVGSSKNYKQNYHMIQQIYSWVFLQRT